MGTAFGVHQRLLFFRGSIEASTTIMLCPVYLTRVCEKTPTLRSRLLGPMWGALERQSRNNRVQTAISGVCRGSRPPVMLFLGRDDSPSSLSSRPSLFEKESGRVQHRASVWISRHVAGCFTSQSASPQSANTRRPPHQQPHQGALTKMFEEHKPDRSTRHRRE